MLGEAGDRSSSPTRSPTTVLKQARLEPGQYVRVPTCRPRRSPASSLRHPFAQAPTRSGPTRSRVLAGDFVTDDAGTGFVHMAPSHGADDYELFVKNGLVDRMTHNVLEDSSFAEHVPFFKGLQVFDAKGKEGKANRAVIDKLIEAGASSPAAG